eukprot:COSAG02_NODE_2636_length_8361_cov_6.129993_7_plen_105_part_00
MIYSTNQVARYRAEHAAEEASKAASSLWAWLLDDPSYIILAIAFGLCWRWRQKHAEGRRAAAEEAAAEARLKAVEEAAAAAAGGSGSGIFKASAGSASGVLPPM